MLESVDNMPTFDMCDILQECLSHSLRIESFGTGAICRKALELHISQAVMFLGFQQAMERVKFSRCFALLQKRRAILFKTSPWVMRGHQEKESY